MLPLQFLPLDQITDLNQPALVLDGALEVQQVVDNIPAAQPGQLDLEMQLGIVLVPHFGLHVERENETSDPLVGLPSDSGLQARARFFALHNSIPTQPMVQVPNQWADFFTAMLLPPQNFNLA